MLEVVCKVGGYNLEVLLVVILCVVDEGLCYVNNDVCYLVILMIG